MRFLGVFLEDPTHVPAVVADYVAEQLGIDDSSVLKAYTERAQTASTICTHTDRKRSGHGLPTLIVGAGPGRTPQIRAW